MALLPADYPLLLPIDDTLERRKGKRIKAKGIYRDACRSSKQHVVTCLGLKWICLMLMVPLPWNTRPWALPVMTPLAPSRDANESCNRHHKTSINWAMVMVRIISRWLKRPWVLIGDGGFACARLGWTCLKQGATLISRLRLDTALYEFPAPPRTGKAGRPCEKGKRVPSLAQRAKATAEHWITTPVEWYGNQRKTVWLQSGIHLWYTHDSKPLPIRWALVTNPEGKHRTEAFFSTYLDLSPEQNRELVCDALGD